ncbi:MAG: Inosose dehydratase [Planctomycetes bacterium]|nr:Inosose dehydratase [Planctomycetota bacterium]
MGFHVSAFGSNQVLAALSALSKCGFEGLEVYADTSHIFADDPGEFRTILDITHIDLAGLHGGGMLTNPAFRDGEMAEWRRLVDWTAAVGGSYVIFYGGEKTGSPDEDLRAAASFLNELGGYAAGRGIMLCYEPDRNCPFDTREAISALMDVTTPGHVWLSSDTAHLARMGFDPMLFLLWQRHRVGVVHMRDLRPDGEPGAAEQPFAEIGKGTVRFEDVVETLHGFQFQGWIVGVVATPDSHAVSSAENAAAYFRDTLRLAF